MTINRIINNPPLPESLKCCMIDNHTHITLDSRYNIKYIKKILDLSETVGVKKILNVGFNPATIKATIDLMKIDKRILGLIALHPNEVISLFKNNNLYKINSILKKIKYLSNNHPIVGIGETGLDYSYNLNKEMKALQKTIFSYHIHLAKKQNLPLQIHTRCASKDTIEILISENANHSKVIIHCFSGEDELIQYCNKYGAFASFAGNLTFNNSSECQDSLLKLNINKILFETDAPFLTPNPYRKYQNLPYMIVHTIKFAASLLRINIFKLCEQTTSNL